MNLPYLRKRAIPDLIKTFKCSTEHILFPIIVCWIISFARHSIGACPWISHVCKYTLSSYLLTYLHHLKHTHQPLFYLECKTNPNQMLHMIKGQAVGMI